VSASRAPRLRAAAGLVRLMLAAGCSSSSPSYATLAKIARAVPVPAGVTFVREDDVPDQNRVRPARQGSRSRLLQHHHELRTSGRRMANSRTSRTLAH
jgi:hypothetical protein